MRIDGVTEVSAVRIGWSAGHVHDHEASRAAEQKPERTRVFCSVDRIKLWLWPGHGRRADDQLDGVEKQIAVSDSNRPVRFASKSYFFNQRTIFFSHNKSTNKIFSHNLSAKRTWQNVDLAGLCAAVLQIQPTRTGMAGWDLVLSKGDKEGTQTRPQAHVTD